MNTSKLRRVVSPVGCSPRAPHLELSVMGHHALFLSLTYHVYRLRVTVSRRHESQARVDPQTGHGYV